MFANSAQFSVTSFPFDYMTVCNAFDDEWVSAFSRDFETLIKKGKPIGKVGELEEVSYSAIGYTPTLSEFSNTCFNRLASVELKNVIAELFAAVLDENITMGLHRHEMPSRPGWKHSDFTIVSFPNVPPNLNFQRIYTGDCGVDYADDSRDRQPNTIKTARAIACIYYIANSNWEEGMGGETGLYSQDGSQLLSTIPPKNNSLLVFEVSPTSYHCYLGSNRLCRSSVIWWYHAPPAHVFKKHKRLVRIRQNLGRDPWDRWTADTVEKFEFQ
jgi:2OG-Fe(II) oxygenase superfamily